MDSGSSSRAGVRRRVARIAIHVIAVLGLFRAEVLMGGLDWLLYKQIVNGFAMRLSYYMRRCCAICTLVLLHGRFCRLSERREMGILVASFATN